MKKRLNFLCALIMVIITVKIIQALNEACFFVNYIHEHLTDAQGKTAYEVFAFILVIPFVYPLVRGIVSFFRFVLNVNRDKVFVKDNVSLLRWAGGGLIYMSVMSFPSILINQKVAQIPLNIGSAFAHESFHIMMGFLFLIIAEVFLIGIKLREEQELTI